MQMQYTPPRPTCWKMISILLFSSACLCAGVAPHNVNVTTIEELETLVITQPSATTILVADTLVVNQSWAGRTLDGRGATLDGAGQRQIMTIYSGGTFNVVNLTFTRGDLDGHTSFGERLYGCAKPGSDCLANIPSRTSGSAVAVRTTAARFTACAFHDNKCTHYAAAAHMEDADGSMFRDTEFVDNDGGDDTTAERTKYDGSVALLRTDMRFDECQFHREPKGAVWQLGGKSTFTSVAFRDIQVRRPHATMPGMGHTPDSKGSCIALVFPSPLAYPLVSSLVAKGCTFASNGLRSHANGGGAVSVGRVKLSPNSAASVESTGRFEGCLFKANWRPYGGAVFLRWESNFDFVDTIFEANSATSNCDLSPLFTLCLDPRDVRERQQMAGGGAIYADASVTIGEHGAGLNVTGCSFARNKVTYTAFNNANDANSVGESHRDGGAIRIFNAGATSNPSIIHDSTFEGCVAGSADQTGNGGAIWALGSIAVSGCLFRNNTAAMTGGAIMMTWRSILYLSRSTFEGNTAGVHGGAVAMSPFVKQGVPQKQQHFSANTATSSYWAGLVDAYLEDTNFNTRIVMTECEFAGNNAPLGTSLSWYNPANSVTEHATVDDVDGERNKKMLPIHDGTRNNTGAIVAIRHDYDANGNDKVLLVMSLGRQPETCKVGDGPPTWSWSHAYAISYSRNIWTNRLEEKFHATATCTACPTGKSWSFDPRAGVSVCKGCLPTQFSANVSDGVGNSSSWRLECKPCDAGHRCEEGAKIPCAPGRYQTGESGTTCSACEPGLYAAISGAVRCAKCEAGTFQDSGLGEVGCKDCPVGRFQTAAASIACDECVSGTYTDATGTVTCRTCDSCSVGYSVNRSLTCTASTGGIAPETVTRNTTTPAYCKGCAPGTFGDRVNIGACNLCPAGYASNETSATTCDICPAGKHAATDGATACVNCTAGRRQVAPGGATCTNCATGEFAPPGSNACISCPLGFRSTGSSCAACEAGTYSPNVNQVQCVSCLPGQFQNSTAKERCVRCGKGTAQESEGQSACRACASGKVASTLGQVSCTECETEFEYVKVDHGAEACSACATNAVAMTRLESELKDRTCYCKDGYFQPMLGLDASEPPNATSLTTACRRCPLGATCNPSLGEEDLLAFEGRLATRPGYWRDRDYRTMQAWEGRRGDTERFLACPVPEACVGTLSVLEALRRASLGMNESESESESSGNGTKASLFPSQCRVGHTGVLCSSCLNGWRPSAAELCVDCSNIKSNAMGPGTVKPLVLFLFSLAFVAILTTILTSRTMGSRDEAKRTADAQELTEDATDVSEAAGHLGAWLGRFGTLAPVIQRIVSLNDVFSSIPWPPIITEVLRIFKIFVMQVGNMLAFVSPCNLHVDIREEVWIALLAVPWAFAVGLAAKLVSNQVLRRRRGKGKGRRKARVRARVAARRAAKEKRKKKRMKKREKHEEATKDASPGDLEEGKPLQEDDVDADADADADANADAMLPARHGARQDEFVATVRLLAIGMLCGKLAHPGISAQLLVFGVCEKDIDVMRAATDVKCDLSDPIWAHVVGVSVAGLVLVTIGLPVLLAWVVFRDHVRFHRERALHEQAAAKDKQQEVMGLLHVKTVQERVRDRVHQWHESRTTRLEAERHRSINWIVAKYKPKMWWWFLVEMLLSLVLISLLQLASGELWHKIYVGILCAALQFLLPAYFEPHLDKADDMVSIVGGCVYFCLVVGRLPRHFVDLQMNAPEFDANVHAAAVHETNVLLDTTFLLGSICMMGVITGGFSTRTRNRCMSRGHLVRRRRRRVVVPKAMSSSGGVDEPAPASVARASKDNKKKNKTAGPVKPPAKELRRCADDVLKSMPAALRKNYTDAWARVEQLQAEICATAIQAAARGHRSRQNNIGHVLASLGRTTLSSTNAKEKRKSVLRRANTSPVRPILRRTSTNSSRALLHSEEKTSALIEAARVYVDGQGEGTGADKQASATAAADALLHAAEGYSAAEISGLHERRRLSDKQVVAIMSLQHAQEHASYQAALDSEAARQKTKGHRRTLRRGFLHHFKASKLANMELRVVLESVDVDADGTIDVRELMKMYKDVFKRELSEEDAQELMQAADMDGETRTLSEGELHKLLFGLSSSSAVVPKREGVVEGSS